MSEVQPKPFVKWAGGKRQLLPRILELVPDEFGTYFEPFVGGGALFFALKTTHAVLGDVNERLMRTYKAVRDEPEAVIALLSQYPYERAFYETIRAQEVDKLQDVAVAAWFIYLNRAGFNGMYRVNRKNEFNVPFGRYVNPTICDAENIRACSRALQGTIQLGVGHYAAATMTAEPGDFVYFDPPYLPTSKTSNFTAYSADGFDFNDHLDLQQTAAELVHRGVHVLISNSNRPSIRELYSTSTFEVHEVEARRSVNSKVAKRGPVKELLIRGRTR